MGGLPGSRLPAPSHETENLFISDLHLVEERAAGGERLHILGDRFDARLGDDDDFPRCLLKS
jgi:hypothetical protein